MDFEQIEVTVLTPLREERPNPHERHKEKGTERKRIKGDGKDMENMLMEKCVMFCNVLYSGS